MSKRDWAAILEHAAGIVHEYDDRITLRQLFYRLVADATLENRDSSYKALSHHTAKARREGSFPSLVDRTRSVERARSFESPEKARDWLRSIYRRDRTDGQEHNVFLAVEKDALAGLLWSWFSDYGVSIFAARGYPSESLCESIAAEVADDGRPAVVLYAGDFDPTGEDIPRDLADRLAGWVEVERIALTAGQVEHYGLPPAPGKASDSRSAEFELRHGRLVQVELDALPPDTLRGVYEDALAGYWDKSAYEGALEDERTDRAEL
jgi:hypothetical protein